MEALCKVTVIFESLLTLSIGDRLVILVTLIQIKMASGRNMVGE